jgi:hypothetical protein
MPLQHSVSRLDACKLPFPAQHLEELSEHLNRDNQILAGYYINKMLSYPFTLWIINTLCISKDIGV